MSELKPCPFHTSDGLEMFSTVSREGGYVELCQVCGAQGPWKPTAEQALAAWNTRAAQITPQAGEAERNVILEDNARLRAELEQARADGERLTNALQKIERWFGEFPTTGEFWADIDGNPDPARPMTYGAKYGSNGERDYMRSIARSALKP